MGQVTIYLDADTEKRAKRAARSEGVSLSKWIASALQTKTTAVWPKAVLELKGAWPDFPNIRKLRRGARPDARREKL